MPAKYQAHAEESSSDDENPMAQNPMDFSRFMNPNFSREFVATLPDKVKARVNALKGLDAEYKELKAAHDEAVAKVLRQQHESNKPLAARRKAIVTGKSEPTEAEVDEGFPVEHMHKVLLNGKDGDSIKGLPNFWLKAMRHHCIINEFITDRDAVCLAFLEDIACEMLEEPKEGFQVVMTFAENEFFEEKTLTKTFVLGREMGEEVLASTETCEITWKEGKNLTVNIVSKKQKSKAKKGATRFVTKEEPCDSFFRFFDSEEDGEEEGEEEGQGGANEEWFALAQTLMEKIVPYAAEYYTGEAADGSSDLEEEDYDDEEEEDEEDEEEDEQPQRGGRGGGGGGGRGGYQAGPQGGRGGRGGAAGADGKDCKQQ